jgi:hypothetical protein
MVARTELQTCWEIRLKRLVPCGLYGPIKVEKRTEFLPSPFLFQFICNIGDLFFPRWVHDSF